MKLNFSLAEELISWKNYYHNKCSAKLWPRKEAGTASPTHKFGNFISLQRDFHTDITTVWKHQIERKINGGGNNQLPECASKSAVASSIAHFLLKACFSSIARSLHLFIVWQFFALTILRYNHGQYWSSIITKLKCFFIYFSHSK